MQALRKEESAFEAIIGLDGLVAEMASLQVEMVDTIARLDSETVWKADGAASMSQWLVARFGVSHQTAAEWVRVGHALRELPHLQAAFGSDTLSWDQVRAVTKYGTPDNDRNLAAQAPGMSVSELRRKIRRAPAPTSEIADRDRFVHFWFDDNEPVLHLRGRLPDAQGVIVAKALDLFTHDRLPDPRHSDEDYGVYENYEARCADALTRMASQALGAEKDADRATVVIHVDAAALAAGTGEGAVEDGPPLLPDTMLRFACDARIQAALDDENGRVVGFGRVSRSIPPWLARQIKLRDKGCRFPGCERSRWVYRHHRIHWALGGRTDLDNLITLCGFHHLLVHEGGWTIVGELDGSITWIRPSGVPFKPRERSVSSTRDRVRASKAGRWLPARVRAAEIDDTS